MADNKEDQKIFNGIFNEKIKKTKNDQAKTKKIINAIDEYIERDKNLINNKLLSIMKDVPNRQK